MKEKHTPHEGGEAVRSVGEFGQVTEWVSRSSINVLPQIRTEFDEVALSELADSIRLIDAEQESGRLRYDLLEPLIEGRHNEESALRYLAQYNRVNGTDFTLDMFTPTETAAGKRWFFHIAGERRLRAGDIIIERDALSHDSVFQCSVKDNPEYIDALPTQFIENNARVNPAAQDEARAIRKYYDAMKELAASMGKRYTYVECARAFAVNPSKITDSVTFTDYPANMQSLVERYPFSMIVDAKDLFEAWSEYHEKYADEMSDEQVQEFIATTGKNGFTSIDEVASFEIETSFEAIKAERLRRRRDPHAKKRDVSLKRQAEGVRKSIEQRDLGIVQGVLAFDTDPENYWTRRKLAAGSLFRAAVDALVLLDRANMLSNDMRDRLGQMAAVVTMGDHEIEQVLNDYSDQSLLK
jgi:hypothetical protein